jgi:tetratricopeptide (TPR) repeat protein
MPSRTLEKSALLPSVLLAFLLAVPVQAQDALERDVSWPEIVARGQSLVVGRFEGQFDGPLFRSRKIRLQPAASEKAVYLPVGDGLGEFVVQLPPGVYTITGLESNYVPISRPMNLRNYRPLRQKFGVRSQRGVGPSFRVPPDRPVYIGTLRAETTTDGLVYQGHTLRVLDEYRGTRERLERLFPRLMASLEQADLEPSRHFVLRPTESDELEFVAVEDPIARSREYISQGKFQSAVNWLTTFMPSSDAERAQARLLMGEALLAEGRHDEAIERLGEVLEAEPDNRRALRLLARAHARAAHYDDAVSLYQELARAIPDDAEANLQLGYLFALRVDPARSAEAFASAFRTDQDYLLHDVLPFVVALKAVKEKPGAYEPPRMIRQETPPPRGLSSRRGAEQSGMALIIDHTGKVVAAQVAGNTSGPEPMLLMSIIRAIFKPAALNGVPVPSLLTFGGSEGKQAQ